MKVYEEYQYGGWRECLKTAPLRHRGGNLGGGTENIVVEDMVYPIEGNGSRESHHGPGYNESNSMFTLNTVERHAVAQVSTGGVQMAVDVNRGENNGTKKGIEVLCILRNAYGEKAVSEWCASIVERIQQTKVLQQGVHEESVSGKATQGNELDDGSLPCTELIAKWLLRDLRQQQECGCTSQGWKPTEQQQGKSDKGLQELSQQNPQTAQSLCDMWKKGKGLWVLRETLSAFQEVRKSVCGEAWKSRYAVRRLTPLEAERLQGLPDGYTLIDDKTCSDSARYKAIGNGMAQPIPDWIIKRIVEEVNDYADKENEERKKAKQNEQG